MRRTAQIGLPALLLIAAACTNTADSVPTTAAAPSTTTSTTSTTTTLPPIEVDRLVIVDDDGAVVMMDRDGSNPTVISNADEIPFQPVWAPDSQTVAYADRAASEFVVAAATGDNVRRLLLESAPFYFYWSPSGQELGSLRNAASGGLVHERFQVGDEIAAVEVDTGAPYYFSWSPTGDAAVAHVGTDRLDVVSTDGTAEALDVVPGAFQAPQWTDRGVVAAVVGEDGQHIARIRDGSVEELVDADGSVIFGVSATDRYLAVQSFNPDVNSVSVALVDEPVPANRLQVVDLDTGERTTVTERPAVAFFWSPVGDRLLIIEAKGGVGDLVLSVWEDGSVEEGPTFSVAPQWFGEFLPFYDQYAQSMSLWAPDSSAYAFVGGYEGERGVFIADLATGSVTRLAGGSWVAWSPS